MKTIDLTYKLQDIDTVAQSLLEHLSSKTVLLYGDMGAGKTTLIQAFLKAMESTDVASSPTFSIVNEYAIPNDKVYHFDFYRVESIEEAYNFGIEDYLYSNCWLFMEWPDRISALLPSEATTITISIVDDHTRALKLTVNTNNLTETLPMEQQNF